MAEMVGIRAGEKPVLRIFSNDYAFTVPEYQRPYSWTTAEAGQLIDDLAEAVSGDPERPYFLGSTVLIKQDGDPNAEIVDGQQRLTTLTILLAILRELNPDSASSLTQLVYERGDQILGTKDRFRLRLRSRDQQFFEQYIQRVGGLAALPTDAALSDSQRNIRDNAILFKEQLQERFPTTEDRVRLAQYLVQRCYLVVVETSDQDSAYRVFSVLNDRGLPLSVTDILKAETIGSLPEQDRETYTRKWEDAEDALGREAFTQLFSHIRMIAVKAKARQSVLAEVREHLQPRVQPRKFIDEALIPNADALQAVSKSAFEAQHGAASVNQVLRWLNRLDNDDWMPAAMMAMNTWGKNDVGRLTGFLSKLERLAFIPFVLRAYRSSRLERYGKVLVGIEKSEDPDSAASGLEVMQAEIQKAIAVLDGAIYHEKACQYVLLRLDETFSEHEAHYNYPVISIEHVLPQSPRKDSQWVQGFSEEERKDFTHRLGNLVLLSRRKNSEAQNFDYSHKKDAYLSGSATSFVLTKRALDAQEWTPDTIRVRQRELITECRKVWLLPLSNGSSVAAT
jgi:hypothetical protein